MNIQIELISVSELADESFNIVIDGLKPKETYRVEMYLSDYYCINAPMLLAHDVLWKSKLCKELLSLQREPLQDVT